jgi:hypothetical protein
LVTDTYNNNIHENPLQQLTGSGSPPSRSTAHQHPMVLCP